MEENYQEQRNGYLNHEHRNDIYTQIQNMHDSIYQLKHEVRMLREQIDSMHISEMYQMMNDVLSMTNDHLTIVKNDIDSQKEEFTEMKQQLDEKAPKQATPKPSEYRQLQRMLQSFNRVNPDPFYQNGMNQHGSRQPLSNNQNFRNTQSTIAMKGNSRTFQNPQSLINKNIITRTSSSKNKR
ncbi:hypothetical protein [Oceanobacillus senegalensis]|uniref:hypothetical protein n=1 Tax=Oceanobacillus senegalensis TaxID=1936063 RepID=UPI000A30F8E9|nr:hypothetical protein [Oceanobacillus senegalensis]